MNSWIFVFLSGHWCGPSQTFTSTLVTTYKNVYNEIKGKFEIVFISCDRSQSEFDSYYQEMSWKALSYSGKSESSVARSFEFNILVTIVVFIFDRTKPMQYNKHKIFSKIDSISSCSITIFGSVDYKGSWWSI